MKRTVTIITGMIFSALIVMFLLNFIFKGSFFEKVSDNTPTKEENDDNKHDIADSGAQTGTLELKYNGTTYLTNQEIQIKNMFSVKVNDHDFKSGATEDGFSLYIEDIQNTKGESLMEQAEDVIVDASDEITVPLSYNEESGNVTFYQSGIYKVVIKVYSDDGVILRKEVSIPVEVD